MEGAAPSKKQRLQYGADGCGEEILQVVDGSQGTDNPIVMMEWERPYMEACVDKLDISPGDSVLEIGFGCGYSASRIQSYNPKEHTIIECDDVVLERVREWAKDKPSVTVVPGIWQTAISGLGLFDCFFFDDFPLPKGHPVSKEETLLQSRWHMFLDVCINWHMRPGSRITGYLARDLSLSRPDCNISLDPFHVAVSKHCGYFPTDTDSKESSSDQNHTPPGVKPVGGEGPEQEKETVREKEKDAEKEPHDLDSQQQGQEGSTPSSLSGGEGVALVPLVTLLTQPAGLVTYKPSSGDVSFREHSASRRKRALKSSVMASLGLLRNRDERKEAEAGDQ